MYDKVWQKIYKLRKLNKYVIASKLRWLGVGPYPYNSKRQTNKIIKIVKNFESVWSFDGSFLHKLSCGQGYSNEEGYWISNMLLPKSK